jgi:hypothetical protein
MTERAYLVAFDELLEFLVKHRLWNKQAHITSINQLTLLKGYETNNNEDQSFIERFQGTWWEVSIPVNNEILPKCAYVADSLTDALRLKPNVALSRWSCSFERVEDNFISQEDWAEEFEPLDFWLLD